jgi:CHAD domain-containing protein
VPETGAPLRVRDVAGSILWRRYEDLRAFEVVVPHGPVELIHQARIAGKRLRYTLELFEEALGPRTAEVLAPLAALQEELGALQDAVVARAHVHALDLDDDPGAQAYLAEREAEQALHLAALPRVWERVNSATFRRRLFELIIRM